MGARLSVAQVVSDRAGIFILGLRDSKMDVSALPLLQIKNYAELLKFQKPIKFPLMRSTTLLYSSQALFIVVFFIKVYFDIIFNLK